MFELNKDQSRFNIYYYIYRSTIEINLIHSLLLLSLIACHCTRKILKRGYVQIAPDDTRNNICEFSRLERKLCTRGIIIENVRFSCKSGGQFYSTCSSIHNSMNWTVYSWSRIPIFLSYHVFHYYTRVSYAQDMCICIFISYDSITIDL
jgi:hypothetical protein